jgi:cobalt-zinc-cadmium efflux system membrane fusion protein
VIAKNAYYRAKAEYARSKEMYGIYSLGKGSHYIIKAPLSGFVVSKDINQGMELRSDNQNTIFTISNLTDVWVIANVYESDIQKIKDNFPVDIQIVAYPDKIFEGKIERIYNVIDPNTRVLKVRIRIDNPDLLLKPGMFATILVHHSTENKMLAIPSKSIIFDSNKNYVMVYKNDCSIETREIEVNSVIGNRTAYLNGGLKEGEKIISKYQLMVFNMLDN